MKGLMRATSHDVAKLAGVSQSTVSRALRGSATVAEETRVRVEKAAKALGYVPSQVGRSLSTRRNQRIGVVIAELTNPFYPHLLVPLQDHLDRAGYRTVLFTERDGDTLTLGDLMDGSIDGVIFTTILRNSTLPCALQTQNVPFVLLNRETDKRMGDAVVVDNAYGVGLIANLIKELGHHRIGVILGPDTTSTGRDREIFFRRAVGRIGISLSDEAIYRGTFSFSTGKEGVQKLLSLADPPSLIFCANDVIALGALDGVILMKRQVPNDLSIIGFDDIDMAGWEKYQLTTVRCDLHSLATTAAKLLVDRMNEPMGIPRRIVMRPELVRRRTHAALKVSG